MNDLLSTSERPSRAPTSPLGTHLIVEFYGARGLTHMDAIDDAMRSAAEAAGAVVLESKFHAFDADNDADNFDVERQDAAHTAGVTGVVLLAESHISVHTWPEHGYAAIDVFMCGTANPERSVEVLAAYFQPNTQNITRLTRGQGPHSK